MSSSVRLTSSPERAALISCANAVVGWCLALSSASGSFVLNFASSFSSWNSVTIMPRVTTTSGTFNTGASVIQNAPPTNSTSPKSRNVHQPQVGLSDRRLERTKRYLSNSRIAPRAIISPKRTSTPPPKMDSHSFHPDGSLMVPVIILAIPQTKPPATKPRQAIPPREATRSTTYLAARQSLLTVVVVSLLTTPVDSIRGIVFWVQLR